MFQPILQAVAACFLWGIVFAMPVYLQEFSSLDIVFGRFLVYGSISSFILFYYTFFKKDILCLKYWKEAFFCALIMNIIYFSALIFGSRFTSPSIITLIIGTGPITITLCSCLLKQDKKLLSLFLVPSLAIFCGLFLMCQEAIQNEISSLSLYDHIQGFIFGLVALIAWTWYVIYNSKILRTNQEIRPVQWTALIGSITFIFTLIGMIFHVSINESSYFEQFSLSHPLGQTFWIGSFSLGILCSWAAFTLWNLASSRLNPALSGQISILETLFGLALIYMLQGQYPTELEITGAFFILSGVSFGLYSFTQYEKKPTPI